MPGKKTEISIEYEEVVIVRKRRNPAVVAWCAGCGKRVSMLGASDAARLAGVSARALYRMVETGQVHFNEARDGSLLICEQSIQPGPRQKLIQQTIQPQEAVDTPDVIDISISTEGEE